jgi:hypothetical protein
MQRNLYDIRLVSQKFGLWCFIGYHIVFKFLFVCTLSPLGSTSTGQYFYFPLLIECIYAVQHNLKQIIQIYWSVFYELCIRTYTATVLTACWIPGIRFHTGYVRLILLVLLYSLRTGLDSLDSVPQWLRQTSSVTADILTAYWIPCIQFNSGYISLVRLLLMYLQPTGLFGYISTVVTSGWFGYWWCTHSYWITWIQFHSGYVRLVWLLVMYTLRTGLFGFSSTLDTSGWFGFWWCTHCARDYFDTAVVASGWFGYCCCTH